VEKGLAYLESLGLKPRLMPNASRQDRWTAGSAQQRAQDINEAFADPEVKVILAAIGGNHSAQVVPYLDFALIRENPKVFQGYSDVTVLHWALLKNAGLRTFYGPALIPELAEHPQVLGYTERYLRAAWFAKQPPLLEPAAEWTDEFLDWDEKQDLTRARKLQAGEGWKWLREGSADGWLLGGCLETICWHLRGSSWWIDPDGSVLFLETSEEAPPPAHVDGYLSDLELMGIFDRIAALIIGRPYGYDTQQKGTLWDVVLERTESADIPVLADVDLGHTDPMLTLPLGTRARLDSSAASFQLLEPFTIFD
jgi:muramoyltetrapeptide carboxypeptidase LdcA involved in peptidoglycan recycling